MRLLFFTPGFAAHEQDSTCLPPLQALVRDLGRKNADVQIIALDYPYSSKPYRWHAATVWPCGGRNWRLLKFRTIFRALRRAQRLHDESRFDCVHSFFFNLSSSVGGQVAAYLKLPHFTTLMGQDALAVDERNAKNKWAENVVALSKFQADAFEKACGQAPGHIIPWGLWEQDVPAQLSAERPFDIVGVGSFLSVKNWSRWLRVLRLLADKGVEFKAVLVGDGPLNRAISNERAQLGLEKMVHFEGALPRPEALARMREAKILLHTADFEGFGYVFPEALANGCRIVATPVGIAPELPEAFTSADDNELADALQRQLALPPLDKPLVPLTMRDCGWGYWDLYHNV